MWNHLVERLVDAHDTNGDRSSSYNRYIVRQKLISAELAEIEGWAVYKEILTQDPTPLPRSGSASYAKVLRWIRLGSS